MPLNPEQDALMQTWRYLALERMPYFSPILYALRPVHAPGLGTAAVDERMRLYIDFDWLVATHDNDEASQVLLHETSHVFAEHHLVPDELGVSRAEYGQMLNIAADMSINDDLRDAGCTIFADAGPYVLPSTYGFADFQTPHAYFQQLRQMMPPPSDDGQDPDPDPGEGQDQGQGQGQDSGQGTDPGSGSTTSGKGPGQGNDPYAGCGSGAGDDHQPFEDEQGDDGPAGAGASDAERQRVLAETAGAINEHATRSRGTVPAGIKARAELILAPTQTPWQQILSRLVRRAVHKKAGDHDTDFTRRNRRRHNAEVRRSDGTSAGRLIIPATFTPVPTIAFVRDTSGSMGRDELTMVGAEVDMIARRMGVRGRSLTVYDVDAAVGKATPYQVSGSIAEVVGGGGTDMSVGVEYASTRKPQPDVVVLATDGFTPYPEAPTRGVPLVVVLVGTPDAIRAAQAYAPVPSWATVVEAPTLTP